MYVPDGPLARSVNLLAAPREDAAPRRLCEAFPCNFPGVLVEKPNRGKFHDHREELVSRGDAGFLVEGAHSCSCLQGRRIVPGW